MLTIIHEYLVASMLWIAHDTGEVVSVTKLLSHLHNVFNYCHEQVPKFVKLQVIMSEIDYT